MKKKWPKPHKVPSRFNVHEKFHVKVKMVPPHEIQGCRGEWSSNEDPDDPCFGVVRISNELTTDATWLVWREELQHCLVDAQRFFLVDYPRCLAEDDNETNNV